MSNSEKVYKEIKDLIFSGKMKPGERLIEKDLCEKFNTSRTPVREALSRLSSEKFIKIVPNKGAQVARLSLKEIEEVQEFRLLIETKCVKEYSKNIAKKDIDKMIHFQNEMKKNIEEMNIQKFVENNASFHSIFINISKNRIIKQIFEDLQNRVNPHQYYILTLPGTADLSIKGHEDIIECFIKNDFKGAAKSIQKHYDDFKPIYKKLNDLNLI